MVFQQGSAKKSRWLKSLRRSIEHSKSIFEKKKWVMKRGDGQEGESKRKFTELRAMFEQNRNENGSSSNNKSNNNGYGGYSNSNSNAGSASVSRKGSTSTIESQTSTATTNSAATTNSNSRSTVSASSARSSNSAASGSTSKQKPKPVLIPKTKTSANSLTASILSANSSATSSASSILSSAETSPPATSPPRRVSSPLVPAGKRSLPSVQQQKPSDKNSKMAKENATSNNSTNGKNNNNTDYGYIFVRRVVYEITGDSAEIAIDTSIRLAATVKNCALRFAITDASEHENLVLRVDKGPVITDSHALGVAIKDSSAMLQLVVSPRRKASILLRDLQTAESDDTENATKAALFKIVGQMSDKEVAAEFINQNGIVKLTKMIASPKIKGSTLSLALTAMQSLLDIHQLQDIFSLSLDSATFITTLLAIVEQQQQIMVSRPATSLLIKLLDSKNSVLRILQAVYTYMSTPPPLQQHQQQQQPSSFVRTLVSRLSLRDFSLQSISLSLINALIHKSLETQPIAFSLFAVFEANGLRSEIASLAYSLPEANNALQVTEVRKLIVEFQRLLVKEWNRRKRANVVISPGSKHEQMLIEIWKVAGLEIDGTGTYKWRRLGFDTDVPRKELSRVGVLGLEIMCAFAVSHVEYYTRFIVNIAKDTTSATMQPLLLEFERVFSITLRLYFRLWLEMEAQSSSDDVSRVGATVRSHFKFCMSTNQVSDVHEFTLFEREMLSTAYSVIKERQMNELNNDFALLEERPFRILRDKLKESNYEFIKEQRITCLLNGAWFPVIKERGRAKNLNRFYRLNSNREFLHYGDFKDTNSLPSLDQLPHKIEISQITDILTGHSSSVIKTRHGAQENPKLTFSIATSQESTNSTNDDYPASPMIALSSSQQQQQTPSTTLADFVCLNPIQFSEWIDGFNMLLNKAPATDETRELIHQLTEHELQLSLLGITANNIKVPNIENVEVPELPMDADFYYEADGSVRDGISALENLLNGGGGIKVKESLQSYDSDEEESSK
ncbi:hypothetical protein HK100_008732 [Physocladia obscura]|uniref:ELMO domain-containing protein n=1 Tax=Physocladia obscura TaxID=109957 RepID=A0AAD5TBT5_9FUNG|nr:hypothetical protein HK100_008732 [Physocladia obscura]